VSQHKSESCCFLKSASVSHAVTLFIDISSVVKQQQQQMENNRNIRRTRSPAPTQTAVGMTQLGIWVGGTGTPEMEKSF
jgi:hypothetical protein